MKIPVNLKFYGSVDELSPIDEVEPYSIYALNGEEIRKDETSIKEVKFYKTYIALNGKWEYIGKTDYDE
jgi:hypothetical protein